MMSLPNQQGVKTVSVMGKPGSSAAQILNSGSGQILALPGSTQTMMIGRISVYWILNSGSGQILALPGSTQTMMIGRHISVLDRYSTMAAGRYWPSPAAHRP